MNTVTLPHFKVLSMQIGLTLLALLCIIAAGWQYQRAQYHTVLAEAFENNQGSDYSVVRGDQLAGITAESKKISLTLRYQETDPQFLLDAQYQSGQPGKALYTPYREDTYGRVVFVHRGWLADTDPDFSRYLDKPPAAVMARGVWSQYHKPVNWLLTENTERFYPSTMARVITLFDGEYLQRFFAKPIVQGTLHAQSVEVLQRERDQVIAPFLTPTPFQLQKPYPAYKNYAYMVQWIIFSLFAIVFLLRIIITKTKEVTQ